MSSILIIEDDDAISNAYATVLEKEGYTVYKTNTGPQAFTSLSNNSINLILLDIMLPGGMNGFDILTRLKLQDQTKNIPVIVMTNLDSEKKTALDYGATDYILKTTTDIKELLEKIVQILPLPKS